MGSSFPNHDAKEQKGQTEKRQKTKETKKNQGQTASDIIRSKTVENNNLYDAWTIIPHDAYSNAARISSISL